MLINELLKSFSRQLSNYSQALSKTSIFVEKPWAMIDEEFELQKLIFRSNGELILSRNGKVQIGSWDYLPEARSLVIHRNHDIILCNEAFIDKGVMILKLDGTENKYFALANENIIPDLDVKTYLENLRKQLLNLWVGELEDGGKLEIKMVLEFPNTGDPVTLVKNNNTQHSTSQPDGIYTLANKDRSVLVKNGSFRYFLHVKNFINPSNELITIHSFNDGINSDGYVFYKEQPFTDGQLELSENKILIAKRGIIKIKDKRSLWKRLFN